MTAATGTVAPAPRPGSLDSGQISLATGDVSLRVPIASLPGRNGLGVELSIRYSSAGRSAATWNLTAPTGPLGLGWSLPGDRVVRDTGGTSTPLDDRYYLLTDGSLYPLVYTGADADGEAYASSDYVFWKIRYQAPLELWVITKENGTRWYFGGNAQTPAASCAAIEYAVARGNWIGASIAAGQQQLPTAWNLTCQQALDGNQITYQYQQDVDYVGAQATPAGQYTVACRLTQITGANGETITLSYAPKSPDEYARANGDPAGTARAYQDRVDDSCLATVTIADRAGEPLSTVAFGYAFIGTGPLLKRLLTSVTRTSSSGEVLQPAEELAYYGQQTADGVSVALTDAAGMFNPANGALWGALATRTTPQGAVYTYQYAAQTLPAARRDLAIPRPQNDAADWTHPQTYFGPDYAVVVWTGQAGSGNAANLYLTAYQWQGRWIAADLGVIPRGTDLRLDTGAQFFAVVTPGAATAVRLFTKNAVAAGTWLTSTPAVTPGPTVSGAVGDRFYALLDVAAGRLYRFTLDGSQWRLDFDDAAVGAGAVHAMSAAGAVVVTACEDPGHAAPSQVRIYHLDRALDWQTTVQPVPFYCPQKGIFGSNPVTNESGVQQLAITVTPTFAVVQSKHNRHISFQGGGSGGDMYRHFTYRWGSDYAVVETRELGTELQVGSGDVPGARVTAIDRVVTIDSSYVSHGPPNKRVAVFDGAGWSETLYTNDSLANNYLGADSFTVTTDGFAQYYELDPTTAQWVAKMLPYADGNQTFWEKLWPTIYFLEGIVALALEFLPGLILDVMFFMLDRAITSLVDDGGAGRGGSRFFTGDKTLWHRDTGGTWTSLGDLTVTYKGKVLGSVTNGWHKEDLILSQQSTQNAAEFVTFTVTLDRYDEISVGGGQVQRIEDPGFPVDQTQIQLLRNGAPRGAPTLVPGGLVKYSGDPDETALVGPNAFFAFAGGPKLAAATSLTLYRVIADDFTGPFTAYVVAAERLDDGVLSSWTHFAYAGGEMHPSGEGAVFEQVTQTFSGQSSTPNAVTGTVESHFYTGLPAAYALSPTDAGNATSYLALVRGLPYATNVLDGTGVPLATTTQAWLATGTTLVGHRMGYWLRPVRTASSTEGQIRQIDRVFDPAGFGFVTQDTVVNRTLGLVDEATVTTHRYAAQLYPDLLALNVLNQIAQTTVTVDGIVTDGAATSFQRWPSAPAPGAWAWPGVTTQAWGPLATYAALVPSADAFDPARVDPAAWLAVRQVTARDPQTGVVIETVNVDGVTTAAIYDAAVRVEVASITNASVARGEAGYVGFEVYERLTAWQLTGTVAPGGYLGANGLAGTPARATPVAFAPRAGVSYVVSAWVQPRTGGAGTTLGFGADAATIAAPASGAAWQYVEHTVLAPTPAGAPFVTCDGVIDDVRFAPVDAAFGAVVYDPSRLLLQATLQTNGEILRAVRDRRQRVVATIGPGEQVTSFESWTYLREAMSDGPKQNVHLRVTASGGGTYAPGLQVRMAAPVTVFDAALATPGEGPRAFDVTGRGWCARFQVEWSPGDGMGGDPATLQLTWGTVRVELAYAGYAINQNGVQVAGAAAPSLPFVIADCMVMAIDGTVCVFQGNQLVLSHAVTGGTGPVVLGVAGADLPMLGVTDVYLLRDPHVAVTYSDALGRPFQQLVLDGAANSAVVTGTVYDGWGRPAVQALPIVVSPAALDYRPGFASSVDWATGELFGESQAYYAGPGQVPGMLADDPSYAATRTLAEATPLARTREVAPPGAAYASGQPYVTTIAYGDTVEASGLVASLGLQPLAAFGFTTVYTPAISGGAPLARVTVVDRLGNTIATREVGATNLDTGYLAQRAATGELSLTTSPPNQYQQHTAQARTSTTDLRGRLVSIQDIDRGLTQLIFDRGGRLRFTLDPELAASERFAYRKYDALGRLIEEGTTPGAWNRFTLQGIADTQPAWPAGDWTTQQTWDRDPVTGSALGRKGRLVQVTARDASGHGVTETYVYDLYGRTAAVTLLVESFDATPRTTAYRYTLGGDVTAIVHPAADGTPTGAEVVYAYDTRGRVAAIGTPASPALYAAYDYALDGRVATEWLGNRTIGGQITYDFQGRRATATYVQGTAPLFSEQLHFTPASGTRPFGVQATLGAGPPVFAYTIDYDEHERLGMATTNNPALDATGTLGPIPYDANGNIQLLTTGGAPFQYTYGTGNQLALRTQLESNAQSIYQWDLNGRLRSTDAIGQITYDPISALPTQITTSQGITALRYSGTRRRVLKAPPGTAPKLYVRGAGTEVLLELRGGVDTQYVHGPSGLVAVIVGGSGFSVVRDSLGSTRALLPFGAPVESALPFHYLPFGALIPGSADPSAAPMPYLFAGRELEPETGFYDFQARLYEPASGRFVAPDPAAEFPSPYVYVGNDPFGRVDPSGQLSFTAYRLLMSAAYVVAYAAIGAGLGALVGGLADSADRGRGAAKGAWIGAAIGGGLGLLRSVAEHVILPAVRAARALPGGNYPVIVYNARQTVGPFDTGRLGAEMIAEAQGIPRASWNNHLVSYQQIAGQATHAPGSFNGRIIAVAHGFHDANNVEVGLAGAERVDATNFQRLFRRGPPLQPIPYRFAPGGVNQLDLCICYPRATTFGADLHYAVAPLTGWNAAGSVTPMGGGLLAGVIRERGNMASEALHWLVPFWTPGTVMPAGLPPAGALVGGWGAI